MRTVFRPFTAVLSAVALASCADLFQSTSPGSGRAALAIVPRFSESASLASATLAEAGQEYNRVRIVIVRPQGEAATTLKDTTFAFTPTSAEITLELSIAAIPAEALVATVEFKQDETIMFRGIANVKALAPAAASSATPIEVEVDYTGPGAAAKTVMILPGAGTYSANSNTQFTAKAFDGTTEVANTPIFWSLSDESKATITAAGLLTPKGLRGTVNVTAKAANGVSQTIAVQLAPAAAGLRVIQGAGQRGAPGSILALPVIVELIAADGLPAAGGGQAITFSASGTAQITPATATFDANGRAQATMKVGTTPGTTYIFTATSGAYSVSWGSSAAVGAPTHFVPSGSTTLTFTAGVTPDPVPTLRVADSEENSVPGLVLKVTIKKNGVLFVDPFVAPADSIGLLEVYRVAPSLAGTYTVLVEADPSFAVPSITYTITINPGAAAKLAFTQMPTSVVSNQVVSPAITVSIQDRFGNAVTSGTFQNINLSVDATTGAGVTINGTGSVAPVNGVATFSNVSFSSATAKTGVKIKAGGANLPDTFSAPLSITPPPI